MLRAALVSFVVLLAGCGRDLRDDFPFDGELPDGVYVTFTPEQTELWNVEVDATHKESWVYVDMIQQQDVKASEAVGQNTWDLGFQRFKIVANSGVDGSGETEVAALEGGDFDAITTAPATGYLRDAADGPDSNGDVDSAFLKDDGWYSYSLTQHKLAARDVLYVVHTRGQYFAMKMLSYYDAAGTGGKLSFRWKKIAAP